MEALIRQTFVMPGLVRIQGRGLLLGLVLDRPAKDVQKALVAKNVLTGTSEEANILRLLPPLTVNADEVAALRAALAEALAGAAVPA